jgi:hypothetical protein
VDLDTEWIDFVDSNHPENNECVKLPLSGGDTVPEAILHHMTKMGFAVPEVIEEP